jgi:hypothetical protein
VTRVVNQHAIAAVRQVEQDVLVGLLARSAAVGVPDVHDLAVLHQRPEALAEPVDELANAKGKLLMNVGSGLGRMQTGGHAGVADDAAGVLEVRPDLHVADGLVPTGCQGAALRAEREVPRRPC